MNSPQPVIVIGDDEPEPRPPPLDPSASTSVGTRRLLFPPLWQRFQRHLQDPADLPPATGAHVTLADLEKLAELREAANPVLLDPPQPAPPADGGEEKISGWVGTPDPAKYVAGTNTLSRAEMEEEVAKGNIVMLDDWVKEIGELDLWQKKMLFEAVLKDWMQNRCFVRTEHGAKVSFWDLYRYVYHNPELKALVESRRKGVPEAGDASSSGRAPLEPGEIAPGLYDDPGSGMWRDLDLETARQMPWGLVGNGRVWSRRPTRWLWGMDAQLDFNFAMYVHEDRAHELLGPKYAHRDPRDVLGDEQYVRDILDAGPLMGMTFMLTAARELPAAETRDAWTALLASRLLRRAEQQQQQLQAQPVPRPLPPPSTEPPPTTTAAAALPTSPLSLESPSAPAPVDALQSDRLGPAMGALFDLYCMVDADRLAGDTQLLDARGQNLRSGSMLTLSTAPGGKIVMQASSPGLAREREGYLLGAVVNEELASALVEEFLGEDAVDAEFAASAPVNMLMFANGFKTDNTGLSDLMRRTDEPGYSVEAIPARASVFRLPRVGATSTAAEGAAPMLLSGVRERALVGALSDVYQRAMDAAEAVAPRAQQQQQGQDEGDAAAQQRVLDSRKEAARVVLEEGLSKLGLNVQGLSFDDMLGQPQPLDDEDLALMDERQEAQGQPQRLSRARCVAGR